MLTQPASVYPHCGYMWSLVEVDDRTVGFPGRPVGLRRAFENLIDNAVKYGLEPTICLQCRHAEVTVTIDDRGPGIPAVALEDVFAPFRRLDPSRNRHTGGMGLGLTSARAIFRAHGGDVVLSNMAGAGLRATVVLPLSIPAKRAVYLGA